MTEPTRPALRPVLRIVRGGEPTPEEIAALTVAVTALTRGRGAAGDTETADGTGEWALQGRMGSLAWAPLSQRWPGEPSGRSWRRVTS